MKKLLLILAAALCLSACTKDESKLIDGTRWEYSNTDGTRRVSVSLTMSKGSTLFISDQNSYYWNDRYEYSVVSYTYDGDKSGSIELRGVGYYTEDKATATFTLNYNQKEMYLSSPNGYYTLERTK